MAILTTLQAYIDDSYKKDDGVFVLAGHIASADNWDHFSKDWDELLQNFGVHDKHGNKHFKMCDMAISEYTLVNVQPFFRVIERYVLCSLVCSFNTADLERAKSRIYVHDRPIDWGHFDNRYMFAFRALMDMFHSHKKILKPIIDYEKPVNFIFDDQSEKSIILSNWDKYIEERPAEIKPLFGIPPKFRDDKVFLPLQAADLFAWWCRKWIEDGVIDDRLNNCDFERFSANRQPHPKLYIWFTEESLVKVLKALVKGQLGSDQLIYDIKLNM